MVNNYDSISVVTSGPDGADVKVNATFVYYVKKKKHELKMTFLYVKVPQKETLTLRLLGEMATILVVNKFTCLQHVNAVWSHVIFKLPQALGLQRFRYNFNSGTRGKIELGGTEERTAMRFEIQSQQSTSIRWFNLFGVPRNFDSNFSLGQEVVEVERLLLARDLYKVENEIAVKLFPTPTRSCALDAPYISSVVYRGIHEYPVVVRKKTIVKKKRTVK